MLPMQPQMDQRAAMLKKKMQGMVDARGPIGQLARGNNVYNGGMPNAQSGPGMNMGPPAGNANAQMDPTQALRGQLDQAKAAMQMAQMKTQRQSTEQNLKNAMERRMQSKSGGPSARGIEASKGKAGGMASLLKRKNDVSAAATRVRNAYTAG